ncbi:hypothetical protein DRP05_02720 [Archaeoglobales archaeon]|nr:MAG: hypothetical protein DRP05_02720 [Archaeoglobales archaeon]
MESKIAKALKLKYEPVAILWSDRKPEDAVQFKGGKWGCVMWMLARAAKGKTAVFDRKTFGCQGGGTSLGFGNQYEKFLGGIEGFCRFLSTGFEQWEVGKELIEKLRDMVGKDRFEKMMHGERYIKSPELVKKFVEQLPIIEIPKKYVIFKPLNMVDEDDEPVVIVFIANPHQLSALIILANYSRDGVNNVIVPMGAGCHQIGIYAYKEAESENPRAVIGLTDLDARLNVRRQLGDDVFTFAVPYKMFKEMENNVEGSFLEIGTWLKLLKYVG